MDLDTALASAKRPERTVALCLRGDLVAEVEELERQLHAVRQEEQTSLAGNPKARELAERIEALRGEMKDSTATLRLRGLSNPEWVALIREHEPRDGNKDDEAIGYNAEAFFPALVKSCLVGVSDEQFDRLYALISAGQFDELLNAAMDVSRRKVSVPKSFAASAVLQQTSETPGQPAA